MYIYDYVQGLKSQINNSLSSRVIKWGNVLSLELWRMQTSPFNAFKILMGTLLFEYNDFLLKKSNSDILLEYSIKQWKRKDYDYIIDNLKSELSSYDELSVCPRRKRLLNIFKIFKIIIVFFSLNKLSNFKNRFIVANLIARRSGLVKKISRYLKQGDYKVLITFCDAHITSNIIVQLANKFNITTVTLQHGQYVYYEPMQAVVHCETYENFLSKYMLVWGEHTISEFSKAGIDKSRLIKSGAIKKYVYKNKVNEKTNTFGIVLSNATFKMSNIQLLQMGNEIARVFNMKYIIKIHPLDNIKHYKKYVNEDYVLKEISFNLELHEYIDNIDFSIIHFSSMYIDLIGAGSPVFIFSDDYNKNMFGGEIERFRDINEFHLKYEIFSRDMVFWENQMENNFRLFIETTEKSAVKHSENIFTIRLCSNYSY